MSVTAAFDTNVLIYSCDGRNPARQAQALHLIQGTSDSILLWQVACEFIAASRKLEPHGLARHEAWIHLSRFVRIYPLMLPSSRVLDRARTLHVEQQWAFWDAMIVSACLEAGVTRLYSEDLPGRAPPGALEIVNPFV